MVRNSVVKASPIDVRSTAPYEAPVRQLIASFLPHSTTTMMTTSSATVVLLVSMAIATLPFTHGLSNVSPRSYQPQSTRRAALLALPSLVVGAGAGAAADDSGSSKMKFQRYPQLRFIAALGDPKASSGTGADQWGLWRDDPGPRGFYLRDYERKLKNNVAPGGWTLDKDAIWIEEHGLVMPSPGDLPRTSLSKSTKESLPYKRYVVTGDREITTVLTVFLDGRWELAKGSLYDVTHLPCRSAKYTPASGSGSCVPSADDQKVFPVKPGAEMPRLSNPSCDKLDYAVLFVLGEEVVS